MDVSPSFLVLLLGIYAVGAIWVVGLLWLTLMKYSGWMQLERPIWLFGSIERATAICTFSLILLLIFDLAVRRSGLV